MNKMQHRLTIPQLSYVCAMLLAVFALASAAQAQQSNAALLAAAGQEKPKVIETLRELVAMETGSGLGPGLAQSAAYLKQRLESLGASVKIVPLTKGVGSNVVGTLDGTGKVSIMLLAHQDTVYPAGTVAKKPFRIDGDRAFGPGIADEKGGIANVLHSLALLQQAGFKDYKRITVLFNADEEVSSPGSSQLITETAAAHDYVFSCEPAGATEDGLLLATSGIGAVVMDVTGRAAHAGVSPEAGRNALVELSHQVLQASNLSQSASGLKLNWTLAAAGDKRNIIPDHAQATADVRVWKNSQYDEIGQALTKLTAQHLVPDTTVKFVVDRRRPAFEAKPEGVRLAEVAARIYAEAGQKLVYSRQPWGGGTDAAFAALSGKPVVLESLGLVGYNFHSSNDEYVDLNSIQPRLYLLSRLIMEVSRTKP
jgi:glutamate carboxypeptidase